MVSDTELQIIADHFKYLIDYLGEDRVGFGSDFDGAMMPKDLNSVLGMHKLIELLSKQNFDGKLMMKITHLNWINLLKRVLK